MLDSDTKLYVKEIVEEAIGNVIETDKDREKRLREVEKKVFNGFGAQIKILFVLHGVVIALAVRAIFF